MEPAPLSRIYDIRDDLHKTLGDLVKDLSEFPGQISAYATPFESVTRVSIYLSPDKKKLNVNSFLERFYIRKIYWGMAGTWKN